MIDAFLYEPGIVAKEIELDEMKSGENFAKGDEQSSIKEDNSSDDDVNDSSTDASEDENDSTMEQSSRANQQIMIQPAQERHPYVTQAMPTSLAKYVNNFAVADDSIIEIRDGAPLCFCKGTRTSSATGHFFPKYEGIWKCHLCNHNFCQTCSFIPEVDNKKNDIVYKNGCENAMCIDCFQYHRLGNEHKKLEKNLKSESEMNAELNQKFGLQLNDRSAIFSETLDIYDAYISSPDNIHDRQMECVRKKVKFPLFPSKSLDCDNDDGSGPIIRNGKVFKLKNGGRFISDTELIKDEEVAQVLDLFASFLEVDPSKHIHESPSDVGQYHYLPNMILNLAYQSRVDSGFRLLKRCVRHTFNDITPSIMETKVELFRIRDNGT